MDLSHAPSWWLLVAGGALALLALSRWAGRRMRRGLLRRRMARAQRGERDAEQLLCAVGYEILGRQVRREVVLEVDGEPLAVALRADYLVRRGRQLLVAEVKTGQRAPQLQTAATRRQLLEYHLAYGADAALLVDMEQGRVHRVRFPRLKRSGARAVVWLAAGAALGAWAVWQLR